MGREDRDKVEIAFAQPPYFRRWGKDVNEAIEEGTGFTSTTSTTSTTVTTTTVTTTTTAPPWVDRTSNTYWQNDVAGPCGVTWNGSAWVSCNYAAGGWYWCYLSPQPGWTPAFRPTKFRITFTGQPTLRECYLKDNVNVVIGGATGGGITSGQEFPITFGANDIGHLELDTGAGQSQFLTTKIEFLP